MKGWRRCSTKHTKYKLSNFRDLRDNSKSKTPRKITKTTRSSQTYWAKRLSPHLTSPKTRRSNSNESSCLSLRWGMSYARSYDRIRLSLLLVRRAVERRLRWLSTWWRTGTGSTASSDVPNREEWLRSVWRREYRKKWASPWARRLGTRSVSKIAPLNKLSSSTWRTVCYCERVWTTPSCRCTARWSWTRRMSEVSTLTCCSAFWRKWLKREGISRLSSHRQQWTRRSFRTSLAVPLFSKSRAGPSPCRRYSRSRRSMTTSTRLWKRPWPFICNNPQEIFWYSWLARKTFNVRVSW